VLNTTKKLKLGELYKNATGKDYLKSAHSALPDAVATSLVWQWLVTKNGTEFSQHLDMEARHLIFGKEEDIPNGEDSHAGVEALIAAWSFDNMTAAALRSLPKANQDEAAQLHLPPHAAQQYIWGYIKRKVRKGIVPKAVQTAPQQPIQFSFEAAAVQ